MTIGVEQLIKSGIPVLARVTKEKITINIHIFELSRKLLHMISDNENTLVGIFKFLQIKCHLCYD